MTPHRRRLPRHQPRQQSRTALRRTLRLRRIRRADGPGPAATRPVAHGGLRNAQPRAPGRRL